MKGRNGSNNGGFIRWWLCSTSAITAHTWCGESVSGRKGANGSEEEEKKVSITASFRSFEISSVNCWRFSRSLCHVTNWSILNSSYMYVECLWIADDPWQPSLPSEFVTLISGREAQCKQHSITGTGHKPRNLDPEFGAFTFPFNALSIKMWRNMTIGKAFSCSFVTCLSTLYDFIRMN